MGLREFFKILSYSGRVKKYIEELEEQVDSFPEGYEDDKEDFMHHLKGFIQMRFFYAFISMVFYASIVASLTASVGFQINVFRRIYGVLGGTTVLVFYFTAMYLHNLAKLDFENSKTRMIALLTAEDVKE